MNTPCRRRLLWDWGPGHSRLALEEDGRVVELLLWREGMLRGRVLEGRVLKVEKRLDAAFIQLEGAAQVGFLPAANALGLSEGARLRVRVKAEGHGAKGPVLTPAGPSDGDEAIPPLARLLTGHEGIAAVLVNDAAALASARSLFPGASLDTALDLSDVEDEAASPVVALPSGGSLHLEHTAAVLAVDVDSGSASPVDANREAIAVLARQIRLRGLGGQMVVDFVSGPKAVPARLAQELGRALAGLVPPVRVAGATRLGLVEMVRPRYGSSVAEIVAHRPSTLALDGLRRVLVESRARPAARLRLALPPEAAQALAAYPEALAEVNRRLGRVLTLRSKPGLDSPLVEEETP